MPTRRRFLAIAAAAAAMPATRLAAAPVVSWRGNALGAHAEVHLAGVTPGEAAPVFAAIEAELERIEGLFSLYRADSALVRLNRDGRLETPAAEMLEILSLASAAHQLTGGIFDPTVQPLYALHAAGGQDDMAARALVGFERVNYDSDSVRLGPEQALTLNGIAQGYATDRIAGLVRAAGLVNVLVDIGEIVGIGGLDADGWQVRLPGGRVLNLRDRAVATSALSGTLVGGTTGHIFRPDGALPPDLPMTASVVHASAAMADALSTAAAVMSVGERAALAAKGIEVIAA